MSSDRCTVMVVDDSEDIRELIGRIYEREGFRVLLAEDGREALAKLRLADELPCVILLDMMMAGMDGLSFRKEQVKDQRLAQIPTILMTADTNAKQKSIEVGTNGYVRKPVDLSTLLAVTNKFCTRGG